MSTETRTDATELLIFDAVVLLLVLMTCLMTRARHAAVHAGISAAFLGPIIALFLGARHFPRVLFGMTGYPFEFGQFALSLWDVNQPLVFSLYGSTAILFVLLAFVSLTKASGEKQDGSVIVTGALLLGVIGAIVSFLAFFTMNRMILAAMDPVETDRVRRFVQSMSIAAVSKAMSTRLVVTGTVSAASALLLALTIALSFVMLRRVRKAIALVAAALAIMVAATFVERFWSELLANAARTGRVPANARSTRPGREGSVVLTTDRYPPVAEPGDRKQHARARRTRSRTLDREEARGDAGGTVRAESEGRGGAPGINSSNVCRSDPRLRRELNPRVI